MRNDPRKVCSATPTPELERSYRSLSALRMDCDALESCKVCGTVFDSVSSLMSHTVKSHAGRGENASDGTGDENREMGSDGEEEEDEEEESDDDDEEDNQEQAAFDTFYDLAAEAVRATEEWGEAKTRHMSGGHDEKESEDLADQDFETEVKKNALKLYRNHLANSLLLKGGVVHGDVREDALDYWDQGFSCAKAARLAIRNHKDRLKMLIDRDDDDDDDDSSSSSSSSESESE